MPDFSILILETKRLLLMGQMFEKEIVKGVPKGHFMCARANRFFDELVDEGYAGI